MDQPDKGDRPAADPPTASSPLPSASDQAERALEANAPADSAVDAARREKINRLKKAVADGTYKVSPEEVARKLIEHMLEHEDSSE